ncbi:MAG TPA: hypothetical protein VMH87_03290 [Pseudomonadales bacterium]|nr:hypothetical protein [Pseudomonadales bacterium]
MQKDMPKAKINAGGKAFRTFLIMAIAVILGACAKAATFADQNFNIEFPPGWQTVTPTPAGVLMVLRSPDASKFIILNAKELPQWDRASGIAEALAGAKETSVKDGFPLEPQQSLTINGVPFRYFVAHQTATGSMATYAAVAGSELYVFALVSKNGDTSTDSELQTFLQSFHLITAVEIPHSTDVPRSAAYFAGRQSARIFIILLVVAAFVAIPIIGILLFIRFVFFKSKATATGPTPPPLPPQINRKNDEESHQ